MTGKLLCLVVSRKIDTQLRGWILVYPRRQGEEYIIMSTYGDDVCGGASSELERWEVIRDVEKHWDSDEVGSGMLLAMSIIQHPSTQAIAISQQGYFTHMLEHFNLQNIQPTKTPLPAGIQLEQAPEPLPIDEQIFMADKPFRKLLGSFMWGSTCTRADIAFVMRYLAHFQSNTG